MKKLLFLAFFAAPALAGEVELNCTEPTQNEDGSPLTDLAGIRFYESTTDGGPYTQVADETVCSTTLQRDPGTYYYVATAYNTSDVESAYSAQASKVVPGTGPAPPTNLTAQADQIAYAIQQVVSPDGQSLTIYPVALVDNTTDCDPYTKVSNAAHPMGLSLIQKDDVTFAPGANANTVYAECSGT